ncbi:peptidase M15A [Rhizobium sp. AC44/96]|uniref:YcbK family protein n=1 Tax=Rhizobium sp. AC44/96 TaxID=1841654 RepID=UPI00080FE924|nr:D-Ala-D-Ala carboxypeptidase family metallohydrolase [Rhizobium sp. AC44/96]OCJ05266.1 peptidase M15A [Rhizobium sp. AC44/96]
MLAVEKRMPLGATFLIAASALALCGCVSDKNAADATAALTPAPAAAAAPAQAAQGAAPAASGYRDPMIANVSGAAAATTDPATAQPAAVGSAASAPANIGGLAMQSTGINAEAMSIFSVRTVPQNNSTSTQLQPGNAYAPGGVNAVRSSVYSSQLPIEQTPQAGQATQPQQSSQNTSTQFAPAQTASLETNALPGQTMNALYTAPKQNLLGSLSGLLQKASLPGMTRTAPNGLLIQNDKVEVGCFKPDLMNVIKSVETHFGKPVVVTSGYRDAEHNRMVGGAEESMHKTCDAADIQISGVSKWDVASYIRSLPNRGGVGTYCHTDSVHLDTGKNRDWNWGCGGRGPQTTIARAL